jgi:hypothetical protein
MNRLPFYVPSIWLQTLLREMSALALLPIIGESKLRPKAGVYSEGAISPEDSALPAEISVIRTRVRSCR